MRKPCRVRRRAERDVDLESLAREANRPGRRGRESLIVLQDAVMQDFGDTFEASVELARTVGSRSYSAERLVVFYPFKIDAAKRLRGRTSPIPGYRPPFDVLTEEQLSERPVLGVVVWSDRAGFKTQPHQERWRKAQRVRRAAEKARPTIVLDVERIRLDRQGYDPQGRYFGSGEPLFRVTSREPLFDFIAESLVSSQQRRLGYEAGDGFWIDATLRAPNARTARVRVAKELRVNARTRPRR